MSKEIMMLAAFELCLGIYCLFLTILDIISAFSHQNFSLSYCVPLPFGLFLIILSIGIFRLKNWARRANNILAAFILFYAAFGLFLSIHNRKINVDKFLDLAPFILFSITALIFFTRKKVSEQFDNESSKVVCRQTFLSGRHKGWYNFLRGARSCLTVTLTTDRFKIRPFFPLSLFSKPFDLEIDIPVTDIQKVELKRHFICPALWIYYKKDANEKIFILYLFSVLIPRNAKPWIEGFKKNGIKVETY